MENKRIFWWVLLSVLIVLILAAGILCQDESSKLSFLKPFAGAIVAMLAPAPFGFFLGFLLGFSDKEKEKTVLAKVVQSGLVLFTGASLVSVIRVFDAVKPYVPIIAKHLCLNSSIIVFLCPTLFFPAVFLGYYLWSQGRPQFQKVMNTLIDISSDDFSKGIDYSLESYKNVLEISEEHQPSGEDKTDKVHFVKGVAKMKLGQEDAYKELSKIKNREIFGNGIYKILAQAAFQANELKDAKKHCQEYLEKHETDTEAAELLLKILMEMYDAAKAEKKKEKIGDEALNFAKETIKKEVLKKNDIEEIWPSLTEEAKNG